ncbi:MAG: HEAT repeat domain-containing protein [Planctomycetota bacterium]|jgi:hypothetical protein
MSVGRGGWFALLLCGVGLLAWALGVWNRGTGTQRGERASRDDSARHSTPPAGVDAAGATAPTSFATAITELAEAIEQTEGDRGRAAQQAAMRLRGLLRIDSAARAEAERLLLDGKASSTLRQAVALVLGTLPGGPSDEVLLAALPRFAGDNALVRCLLFALGATRDPPEDDDVFGLGDDPWGVRGPAGIGITVRRAIEDARVRAVLAHHLGMSEAVVREAAAISLRHSIVEADARSTFLAVLAAESTDEVAMVLGEALAQWAGGTGDRVEQEAVLARLLARAGDPGLDAYRLRMEDDFRRILVSPAQQATLRALAGAPHETGVRQFAMAALVGSAVRSGTDGVDAAERLLTQILEQDETTALRDHAARLMGELPSSRDRIATLARVVRGDAAWNVRWQALGSLARLARGAPLRSTLEAATRDPDPRVRKRARELLARAR